MAADLLGHVNGPLGLGFTGKGLTQFLEEVVDDGGDEPPEYVFVGKNGSGRVTAKQFTEFRYCDPAIAAATGEVVDQVKPTEWRRIRRALLAAKTVQKLGAEAGVTGTVRDRLVSELRTYRGYYDEPGTDLNAAETKAHRKHIEEGLSVGYPVHLDGRVWFSVEAMLDRLDRQRVRYVRRELMRGLLALGCREKRVEYYATGDGSRTSRTLYAVPADVLRQLHPKPDNTDTGT